MLDEPGSTSIGTSLREIPIAGWPAQPHAFVPPGTSRGWDEGDLGNGSRMDWAVQWIALPQRMLAVRELTGAGRQSTGTPQTNMPARLTNGVVCSDLRPSLGGTGPRPFLAIRNAGLMPNILSGAWQLGDLPPVAHSHSKVDHFALRRQRRRRRRRRHMAYDVAGVSPKPRIPIMTSDPKTMTTPAPSSGVSARNPLPS